MRKFLFGRTQKELHIQGIVVPKKVLSDNEIKRGKKTWTLVTEKEYAVLMNSHTFNEMLRNDEVYFTEVEPEDMQKAVEDEKNVQPYNRQAERFQRENRELKKQLAALEAENESLRKRAGQPAAPAGTV